MTGQESASRQWGDLVRWRWALDDVLAIARLLPRQAPGFCANGAWHRVFEPLVEREVGWHARAPRCTTPHVYTLANLDEPEGGHVAQCQSDWTEQEWLTTSEAYDLAFRQIYDALPDCQHPPTLGCV